MSTLADKLRTELNDIIVLYEEAAHLGQDLPYKLARTLLALVDWADRVKARDAKAIIADGLEVKQGTKRVKPHGKCHVCKGRGKVVIVLKDEIWNTGRYKTVRKKNPCPNCRVKVGDRRGTGLCPGGEVGTGRDLDLDREIQFCVTCGEYVTEADMEDV